ncbi:hypothetical protein EVG20_g7761 [Dentipellis fragilis]|uniref:F-box domain-containing protein n=1 Tax=Dentipellis fragilis TaxID=205917 RepID=A0A4Y9YBX7_9AGAM|nr:hypothetical protein EVG20_g7761 [Dentipellis fragilis]
MERMFTQDGGTMVPPSLNSGAADARSSVDTHMAKKQHGDDAASRSNARKDIETQIIALVSRLRPSNIPQTLFTAHRVLAASLPSGDPEVLDLLQLFIQYNTLAPLHILPPEILLAIFSNLVHDPDTSPRLGNQRLTCASAVSSYWRRLIVSSPQLWTRIDLAQEQFATLALGRSQNAPIDLILYSQLPEITPPNVAAIISHHASHIAMLDLMIPYSMHDMLQERFPSRFPVLHTLSLKISVDDRSFQGDPPILYASAMNTAMPAVRTLKLEDMWLPWTLPLFRGLENLRVEMRMQPSALSPQPFPLPRCPDLESESESRVTTPPVSLSRLRMLNLHYRGRKASEHTVLVLENLAIPHSAAISLRSWEHSARGVYFTCGEDPCELCVAGDGGGLQLLRLLRRFPCVRNVVHLALYRLPEDPSTILALLAELNTQQLETLLIEGATLAVAVEALKNRDFSALQSMGLMVVPRIGTKEEEDRDMGFLKGLAPNVAVSFREPRTI